MTWHHHLKHNWQYLKKLNIHTPFDPGILLLGIDPREIRAYVHKKTIESDQSGLVCNNSKLETTKPNIHQTLVRMEK